MRERKKLRGGVKSEQQVVSVTIELKPATHERAARDAARRGISVEAFLTRFVEDSFGGEPSFAETATMAEWEAALDELGAWADDPDRPRVPPLSDEAISRESIYEREDHQL